MANTISAQKRVRIAERRTANINRTRKTHLRHQIRAMRRLLESNRRQGGRRTRAQDLFDDRSRRQVGIIKKNTAARYKSRNDAAPAQARCLTPA